MNRSSTSRSLLFSLCTAILFALPASAAKPNIILILCDDLGYGDVSCYNPEAGYTTPNIDKLAEEGMKFAMANSPDGVCTPARYATLTGRYCWRSRMKSGYLNGYSKALIEKDRMTLASMLKLNGYNTALVGKWHLGLDWSLKNNKAQSSSNIDYTKPLQYGPKENGFTFSFHTPSGSDGPPGLFIRNGIPGPREGYIVDSCLPFEIDTIESYISRCAANPDTPFYLHFTPQAPHWPWVPTQKFKDAIKAQTGKEWDYGAFVLQIDDMVGRIVKLLDSLHIRDNTLVIFTSDNGAEFCTCKFVAENNHYSSGILRGYKRDTWQGGHHVPFIASWPGKVPANTVTKETVCLTDLMATFAAIVGYRLPDTVGEDSFSLLPLFLDKPFTSKPATICHGVRKNGYAILTNKWAFLDGKGSNGGNGYPITKFKNLDLSSCYQLTLDYKAKASDPPYQLYDLENDLSQTKNLYETYKDTATALLAKLTEYRNATRSAPADRNDAFFEDLVGVRHDYSSSAAFRAAGIRVTVSGSLVTVTGAGKFGFELFDLKGCRIASLKGIGGQPLSLPAVRAGTYIAKISSVSSTVSGKVLMPGR